MNPRVSVAMPVYNGAQYLARAIASVIAQDYDNFEIIIVDDGSTDADTQKIALAFRDAHAERVKYFRKANGGVASALNTAVAAATGQFFCWLSHDDMYYSDF